MQSSGQASGAGWLPVLGLRGPFCWQYRVVRRALAGQLVARSSCQDQLVSNEIYLQRSSGIENLSARACLE